METESLTAKIEKKIQKSMLCIVQIQLSKFEKSKKLLFIQNVEQRQA